MNATRDISEQLSAYLDGELSEREAREVEQALRDDESLARELGELRSLRRMIRVLPAEHAPGEFTERVMAQAERRHLMRPAAEAPAATGLAWVRHLASAAILLIAASVGVIIALSLWSARSFEDQMAENGGTKVGSGGPKEPGVAAEAAWESRRELIRQYRDALADWERVREIARRELRYDVDDLDRAQRTVEGLLARNGISKVETAELASATGSTPKELRRRLANFYQANRVDGDEVHFFVLADGKNVSKVAEDLEQTSGKDVSLSIRPSSRGPRAVRPSGPAADEAPGEPEPYVGPVLITLNLRLGRTTTQPSTAATRSADVEEAPAHEDDLGTDVENQ